MKFDFAAITVPEAGETVVKAFESDYDYAKFLPTGGWKSYIRGGRFTVPQDQTLTSLYWKNPQQPKTTHVRLAGARAAEFLPWFRERYPEHNTSRLDSCEDYRGEGSWETLTSMGFKIAERYGVRTANQGDWYPHHGAGRTLYIGSRQSQVSVRIYEKGKKEGEDPTWVRVEIEVKPKSRNKPLYANTDPVQLWASARWTQEFFRLLSGVELERLSLHKWSRTDFERREIAMLRQYGNHLEETLGNLSSLEELGPYLVDRLSELRNQS